MGPVVRRHFHALYNQMGTLESKVSDLCADVDRERQELSKQRVDCTIDQEKFKRSLDRHLRILLHEQTQLLRAYSEEHRQAVQELQVGSDQLSTRITESDLQFVPNVLFRPSEHAAPESDTTLADTIMTPASVRPTIISPSLSYSLMGSQNTIVDDDATSTSAKPRPTIVLQFLCFGAKDRYEGIAHVKMFRDTQLQDLRNQQWCPRNATFVISERSIAIFAGDTPDSVRCDVSESLDIPADSVIFQL